MGNINHRLFSKKCRCYKKSSTCVGTTKQCIEINMMHTEAMLGKKKKATETIIMQTAWSLS